MTAPLRRLVFFGTPEFAVPSLQALVDAGRPPLLVVAQPSRPAGRHRHLADPPVVALARRCGLAVAQPARLRDENFQSAIAALEPDLGVVVAYGRILPTALLDTPRAGFLNLHASLLPRWRGAAPIQAAIAAGESATGVTIMRVEPTLDTGPILAQRTVAIGADETAGELSPRLAQLGAALLVETIAALEAGAIDERVQDDGLATQAPILRKEDGRVRWLETARAIADRRRAHDPWPGTTAELRGEPVRLLGAHARQAAATEAEPGTIVALGDDAIDIAAGDGTVVALTRLQRPGRKPVAARDFANGEHLRVGERFA